MLSFKKMREKKIIVKSEASLNIKRKRFNYILIHKYNFRNRNDILKEYIDIKPTVKSLLKLLLIND